MPDSIDQVSEIAFCEIKFIMLCVSLEVRYNPEHTFMKDGVMFIDAHEDNALTGMCIVSHPAEVRATA